MYQITLFLLLIVKSVFSFNQHTSFLCCYNINSYNIKSKYIRSYQRNDNKFSLKKIYKKHSMKLFNQNNPKYDEDEVPRLHADIDLLIEWIIENNGIFNANIKQSKEGWTLTAKQYIPKDEILMKIPKSLCIYSDPSLMKNKLLDSTSILMNTLLPSHWRIRLAIALLSERVKPDSFFNPYLRNLPFEFWGMPVFFSATEFRLLQDYSMMSKTRDRCKFLGEFTSNVLVPLQKTINDPFSGNLADVNAFGWGFASASSRAIRNIRSTTTTTTISIPHQKNHKIEPKSEVVSNEDSINCETTTTAPVIIPGIDIASHSFDPNCEVSDHIVHKNIDANSNDSNDDNEGVYILKSLRSISAGEEITISYGELSNDELFSDYGFTIDNNPYDYLQINMDELLLNTARSVMNQSQFSTTLMNNPSINLLSPVITCSSNGTSWIPSSDTPTLLTSTILNNKDLIKQYSPIGYIPPVFNDELTPSTTTSTTTSNTITTSGGSGGSITLGNGLHQIDPRLLAMLRVLYTLHEDDLWKHGYDPVLLQKVGSILSYPLEAHILRTLIGIVTVILSGYGSDVEKDRILLEYGIMEADSDLLDTMYSTTTTDDQSNSNKKATDITAVKSDCLRFLRNIFNIPHINAISPTVRKISSTSNNNNNNSNKSIVSKEELSDISQDNISNSNSGLSLEDLIRKEMNLHKNNVNTINYNSDANNNNNNNNVDIANNVDITTNNSNSASKSKNNPNTMWGPSNLTSGAADTIINTDLDTTTTTTTNNNNNNNNVGTTNHLLATGITSIKEETTTTTPSSSSSTEEVEDSKNLLPVNVRESYLYRIRKKTMLMNIVKQLATTYEVLRNNIEDNEGIPKILDLITIDTATSGSSIGNNSNLSDDKTSRSAQIRELLEETKQQQRTPKHILAAAISVSNKWAQEGLDL